MAPIQYPPEWDILPSGHILWKGTDVCIDLYCVCGKSSHFDGDFLYFWQCPYCGARYAVDPNVKLHAVMAPDQIKSIEASHGFKTSEREA